MGAPVNTHIRVLSKCQLPDTSGNVVKMEAGWTIQTSELLDPRNVRITLPTGQEHIVRKDDLDKMTSMGGLAPSPADFADALQAKVKAKPPKATPERTLAALRKRPTLLREVAKLALDQDDLRIVLPMDDHGRRLDAATGLTLVKLHDPIDNGKRNRWTFHTYDPHGDEPWHSGHARSRHEALKLIADTIESQRPHWLML